MATIRKLPSGKWNAQVRREGKLVASSTHTSREDAEEWGNQRELALGKGHPLFIDAGYSSCHEVLDCKPSQLLAFNRIDRICKLRCMQKTMDAITLQDVHSSKLARLEEVSTTTCRDECTMIRRVFRWYIREHLARTGKRL